MNTNGLPTFDQFMHSPQRNAWVNEVGFEQLYVRKGPYGVHGKLVNTIQIANVTVADKGKGVFTKFVNRIQEQYCLPIVVEQVLQQRFAWHLGRERFLPISDGNTFIRYPATKPAVVAGVLL